MVACFVSVHSIMDTPLFSGDTVHGARNCNATRKTTYKGKNHSELQDHKLLFPNINLYFMLKCQLITSAYHVGRFI